MNERPDNLARQDSLEAYFDSLHLRDPKAKRKKPPSFGRQLVGFFLTFIMAFMLVFLVRSFALQHNTVVGSSMLPTLEQRDGIFVEKISKHLSGGLKRGDIVTVDMRGRTDSEEEKYIIKRVVGLPLEHVILSGGNVFIDGIMLDEPYLPEGVLTDIRDVRFANVILAADEYYLMGDNRSVSHDSRSMGPFALRDVEGRMIFRFYPFDRIGTP
jgi:signal peptidase I